MIWPYLKSQGITRLDAVFVTHPDADHINGIEELLALADGGGLRIGRLFLPEWMQEDEDASGCARWHARPAPPVPS